MDALDTFIRRYWGKADEQYVGTPKWHPLVYHCLDIAAVATVWWDSCPVIRSAFASAFKADTSMLGALRAWVLFFIALHDLGKFDVRFQLKALQVLCDAWPELDLDDTDPSLARRFDHGRGGYAWAIHELPSWMQSEYDDLRDTWQPWLAAVTGHHGDLPQSAETGGEYAEAHVMTNDREARKSFVLAMARLFLGPSGLWPAERPVACPPPAQSLLAGFCAVCDWVGSNIDISPYAHHDPVLGLQGYFDQRVNAIRTDGWLSRLGLVRESGAYRGLSALLKPDESPRGVQVRVDELARQPGLVLIEAPTGSGKTEAALAHAWRLLDAGCADSIVFALPTQATANAMLARAELFAAKAFGNGPANVVLAHGKRNYNHSFERLVQAGSGTTAQGSEEAAAQCAAWLAQSRKRVFLGQIGVCTVDQVLLSVLPVRHKFVRGFGLNKSVLIVDEVHAYDAYMHGLLAEVLRRQRDTGGSAVLLSATLPSGVREKLLGAWGCAAGPIGAYPVIWQATDTAQSIEVPDDQRPPEREVLIECLRLPGALPDTILLDRIVAAAAAGARVAVILNLVDVAQQVARELRARTHLPVDLFHARYRFIDRQTKETAVLAHYGREAARDGGRILVATQVVEQSLDLDFDWMVTQICPVDLLFQRLGRLHRHPRRRPDGFEQPRCTVLTVDGEDYCLHKLIYGNTRVLWRTEQRLAGCDRIAFPAAYREWIETGYQDEEWPDEPERVAKDYRDWLGKQMAAEWEARQMITTPRKPFGDEDAAVTVKTRDGEMSLTVLPLREDGRLLDGTAWENLDDRAQAEVFNLNAIPVPASWRKRFTEFPTDDEGRFRLRFGQEGQAHVVSQAGRILFRYTEDFGLERENDEPA